MKTNRREFLLLTTISPFLLNKFLIAQPGNKISSSTSRIRSEIEKADLLPIPIILQDQFRELFFWLKESGWTDFLAQTFKVSLNIEGDFPESELFRIIDNPRGKPGFEDFGGKRLIEPGDPAMSLVYYALASSTVRLPRKISGVELPALYPTIEQLDVLENYIYAINKTDLNQISPKDHVLAVFAYEFRPREKVPHQHHADFVYSRTGIARVGDKQANYDPLNRCFTNKPLDPASEKNIASTPARYGLFLAKKVKWNELSLMTREDRDAEKKREFLLPIRKVFSGDFLLGGASFEYTENHRNEKLFRLVKDGKEIDKKQGKNIEFRDDLFEIHKPPFQRISHTTSSGKKLKNHNSYNVELSVKGSSVILGSIPEDLVREAFQENKRVTVKVPESTEFLFGFEKNRRYAALKLQVNKQDNALDYVLTDFIFKKKRATRFSAPRNAPLFVNIKNKISDEGKDQGYLSITNDAEFDRQINDTYWAGLYEDSICDGCITVICSKRNTQNEGLSDYFLQNPLPAFSLVTAPDFFQYVDSGDIIDFDKDTKGRYKSNFLQGGVSTLR